MAQQGMKVILAAIVLIAITFHIVISCCDINKSGLGLYLSLVHGETRIAITDLILTAVVDIGGLWGTFSGISTAISTASDYVVVVVTVGWLSLQMLFISIFWKQVVVQMGLGWMRPSWRLFLDWTERFELLHIHAVFTVNSTSSGRCIVLIVLHRFLLFLIQLV